MAKKEELFIAKLGTPEEIVYRIKKESTFVENVKARKNYNAGVVFSKATQIIGYIIYGIIMFV